MAIASKKRCLDLLLRLAAIGSVLLAGAASCAPAVDINVTGEWVGVIAWTNGPIVPPRTAFSLSLLDDRGTVVGSGRIPTAGADVLDVAITRGEVHADTVVLDAVGAGDPTAALTLSRFTFDGEATPTSMSGIGTLFLRGKDCTFTWQAELVASPVVALQHSSR